MTSVPWSRIYCHVRKSSVVIFIAVRLANYVVNLLLVLQLTLTIRGQMASIYDDRQIYMKLEDLQIGSHQ